MMFFLLCALSVSAQKNTFRVMFYNVENLFDTEHEPNKQDVEFTPEGNKHWNKHKYYDKLENIAKVITAVGEWDTPVLVGLSEVENNKVLKDLTQSSPLRKMQYRYVLTESRDPRGIDVALLYQRDRFKYLSHDCIRIKFPGHSKKRTRDLLHVTGQISTGDTLDVFVVHFPSRRAGQQESEPDRLHVASVLRAKTDSLARVRTKANLIIMGDFNDEPSDRSISQVLNTKAPMYSEQPMDLFNLFLSIEKNSPIGTYKYRNQWNFLDQIIVSGNLLNSNSAFQVLPETARIFQADFLLVKDKSNGGRRPKKTFNGRNYEGGYSDHLPVFVDFQVKTIKK